MNSKAARGAGLQLPPLRLSRWSKSEAASHELGENQAGLRGRPERRTLRGPKRWDVARAQCPASHVSKIE